MKTKAKQSFTRQQYLDGKCTHEQYYAQFLTEGLIEHVKGFIGEKEIKESIDEHFNDIKLPRWDSCANSIRQFPYGVGEKMKKLGDYPTLAGWVCVCKAAARIIKES